MRSRPEHAGPLIQLVLDAGTHRDFYDGQELGGQMRARRRPSCHACVIARTFRQCRPIWKAYGSDLTDFAWADSQTPGTEPTIRYHHAKNHDRRLRHGQPAERAKSLRKSGLRCAEISGDPNRIAEADCSWCCPVLARFRDAIAAALRTADLVEPIRAHIHAGKPFFGICLGLQLLFTTSHEDGVYQGMDVFPGEVVRFTDVPGLKVPHMGWNQLQVKKPAPHLAGLGNKPSVYFVHSYYVVPKDTSLIAAQTDYPTPFTSAIWQDNVFATQFHPEKSQRVGLAMLHKFGALS